MRALRVLLFEPGRGWLRWGVGEWHLIGDAEPCLLSEPPGYVCAPPLRRLALPIEMAYGYVRDALRDDELRVRDVLSYIDGPVTTWRDFRDPGWPKAYLR